MMPFDARHVMNSILERSFKEKRGDMSPMKAQKMLFYTHGWHLAVCGEPAVDQSFEVWPYGPVVPAVYHELKKFGAANINKYISEYAPSSGERKAYVVNKTFRAFYEALDIAWEKYIGIDAVNLSAMTHEDGSPWDRAKSENLSKIPNKYIQEYFVELAR